MSVPLTKYEILGEVVCSKHNECVGRVIVYVDDDGYWYTGNPPELVVQRRNEYREQLRVERAVSVSEWGGDASEERVPVHALRVPTTAWCVQCRQEKNVPVDRVKRSTDSALKTERSKRFRVRV